MPRFFVDEAGIDISRALITLDGENASHISLSLRMRCGEEITVCSLSDGTVYNCEISEITKNAVTAKILNTGQNNSEPDVYVRLFQALPKSDKLELVIQKCVELGVGEIVPVITDRCVSRPDAKSLVRKLERWNRIALEAAQQSGRCKVPMVCEPIDFQSAVREMKASQLSFMCYEKHSGKDLCELLRHDGNIKDISFFVGPEGGISEADASYAADNGITLVGLGKRILRTETAPICVLSGIMFLTDNMK